MAIVDFAHREIIARIVYFGAPDVGCNTNVEVLHALLAENDKSRLHRFGARDEGESCYFDYAPREQGNVVGFSARIRVYSMPGGVRNPAHRDEVLRGTDGVVFVADAREGRGRANRDAALELEEVLAEQGLSLASLPGVVQVNHTDAPGARAAADVAREINPHGFPVVEAVARAHKGVLGTHEQVVRAMVARLRDNLAGDQAAIALTAVHRAQRERDDDVVKRHLAVIRGESGRSGGSPRETPSQIAADLETSVSWQPRALVGTRPVRVIGSYLTDDSVVCVDLIVERLSGGEARRVRVLMENRPLDEALSGPNAATPVAPPLAPPLGDALPSEITVKVERRDSLYELLFGVGGFVGGALVGFFIGVFLFYGK